MRICGHAQLLNCSYLVDHISLPLLFMSNSLAKGLFQEIRHDISCASLPSAVTIYKFKGLPIAYEDVASIFIPISRLFDTIVNVDY